MALLCDVPLAIGAGESELGRRKTPRSGNDRTQRPEHRSFIFRQCDTYSYANGWRRYNPLHTANSTPAHRLTTTTTTTTRKNNNNTTPPIALPHEISVLVTTLLESIKTTSTPYGTGLYLDEQHHNHHDDSTHVLDRCDSESLARACILVDSSAPCATRTDRALASSLSTTVMDSGIDFGSTAGFRERAKKKKGATNKFDPWGDSEKKEDGSAGGDGTGDNDNAGDGGSAGGGGGAGNGGDDNNNGDNGGEDDWGFSTGKKTKKKTKKRQDEEDEEEGSKTKNEEEPSADPLSWANDTNENAGDDWTNSWSTGKKEKKKKNGALQPDAPSTAASGFQDISLDDTAPKLDFSFDGIGGGGAKKTESSGAGYNTWGNSWDFASTGKMDDKKDDGTKSKKNNMSNFDFGDFGTTNDNSLSFGGTDDVTNSKAADDAWGFSAVGKADKKKKNNGITEIQEEETGSTKDDGFVGWGASKTKKKTTTKSTFDDDFLNGTTEDTTTKTEENAFDWGFGAKKGKQPSSTDTKEKNDAGANDWMSGTWDASSKKGSKKKGTEDLISSSMDLGLNAETKNDAPADDLWAGFSTGKDKKKDKGGMFGEITAADDAGLGATDSFGWDSFSGKKSKKTDAFGFDFDGTNEAANESTKEPLVAWDDGLSSKDKRRIEKEMKLNGTWETRVTQEMVDEAAAAAATTGSAEVEKPADNNVLGGSIESLADKLPWDHGLTPAKKKKLEKEMKLNGTWDSRITQDMIDDAKTAAQSTTNAAVETDAFDIEPTSKPESSKEDKEVPIDLDSLVPWDHGLTPIKKRKKEKEMRVEGTWDDRLTEEKIEEMRAAAAAKNSSSAAVEEEASTMNDFVASEVPPPPPPAAERTPWDHGLTTVKKKKLEKEMRMNGTWETRLTQEQIDEDALNATLNSGSVEPEVQNALENDLLSLSQSQPTTAEPKVAWDFGLTPIKKRKKEREMKMDGSWDNRITQEQIDEETLAASLKPVPEEPIVDLSSPPLAEVEDRVAWDHGLGLKDKKKKEKEMRANGTWEDRLTQEKIDADADAALDAALNDDEPLSNDKNGNKEERVAWDHGLSPKEKKKKEKDMKIEGTWEDRVTQEMIDDDAARFNAAPEPEFLAEREENLDFGFGSGSAKENKVAWDHGLDVKARKKKEREMRANYTWDDRVTQEMIDAEKEAAETATNDLEKTASSEPTAEQKVAWDHGLDAKAKRKKEKEMRANFTWDDRVTQEMIDAEQTNQETHAEEKEEPAANDETSEPRIAWDHGLDVKARKKKEREMKLNYTWEDRVTQEMIDEENAAKANEKEPEPVEPEPKPKEPRKPWDHGLTMVQKRKKEREMRAEGTWDDRLTQKKIDEEDATEAVQANDRETDQTADAKEADGGGWGFGWGAGAKSAKNSTTILDPAPAKEEEKNDNGWGGDNWAFGAKDKKKAATPKEEKTDDLWSFGASAIPSTSKSKKESEKDKAKRIAEEEAAKAAEEEEAAKLKKSKSKTGKTTVATPKAEEKKKSDDLLDLLDEPLPTTTTSSKSKKTTKSTDNKVDESLDDAAKPATDYFGFWGGSKKTTGKKETKEINSKDSANGVDGLPELNEDEIQAVLDDFPTSSSAKVAGTMSSGKTKTTSSITDKIKAFEGVKEVAGKKSKTKDASVSKDESALEDTLFPIEEKKATKDKASTKTSTKSKIESTLSPPTIAEQKRSREFVPGSFPGAFDAEEDHQALADEAQATPSGVKTLAGKTKAESKLTNSIKTKKASVTFDKSMDKVKEPKSAAPNDIQLDEPAARLPTPPSEDDTAQSKKERPRVVRSSTTSWGLWGASTPKKSSKSKTAEDALPPEEKKVKSPPTLTRSKSSRTPKEKAVEDKKEASKSSGSDAESSAKKSDRPKASRGLSFTNFMLGGAPPSAMRNANTPKRSNTTGSRSSSRRQSIDQSGLISPPADEDVVEKKSGKSRGLERRSSSKQKTRSYPDPYAIDDGDIVVVDANDDGAPTPKGNSKTKADTSTKRSSTKPRSKTLSGDEDVVMVDSPVAIDGVLSGGDDTERPALSRNNTAKRTGLFGALFGSITRAPAEKTGSNPVTDAEDNAAPRSRGTSRRRRTTLDQEAGLTTDGPGETDAEAASRRKARRAAKEQAEEEERTAREQRRKERRDREKADLEARRERAREQARKEREEEEARRAEKRARRRQRETEEQARIEREEAEAIAATERRREERRRLREKLEAEAGPDVTSKEERRRTYADEEDLLRSRRRERSKSRTKESKRRSTALMAEYHESRSGSGKGTKPPANKTSNWVHSVSTETPDPPPIEGTILDESGQQARPVHGADTGSRRRHRSDKDKYAGMTEEEIAEYRAQRRERKLAEKENNTASGGSEERREKDRRSSHRRSRVVEDDYYANASPEPVRTFDGRPSLARGDSKRNSFLSKFF